MTQDKNPVVQKGLASQVFFEALDASFDNEVFAEMRKREPELVWLFWVCARMARTSVADSPEESGRSEKLRTYLAMRNVACLMYRCLTSGYRDLLPQNVDGLAAGEGG